QETIPIKIMKATALYRRLLFNFSNNLIIVL
ncbi:MAG: hypothetical protein ACI97R_000774, partial [Candidatus Azotimanducaceae bacterium]